MLLILLSILLPILVIVLLVVGYIIIKLRKISIDSVSKGRKIYKYDDKKDRVFLYDQKWNKKSERLIFGNNASGKWIRSSWVFQNLKLIDFKKKLANAVINTKSKHVQQTFEEIVFLKHKKKILLKVVVAEIENSAYLDLIISWHIIKKIKKQKGFKEISKEAIINDLNTYKTFTGFNLNAEVNDAHKLFMNDMHDALSKFGKRYFFSQNTIIFYESNKKRKNTEKKLLRCSNKFIQTVKKNGANRLFSGSGFVISKEIDTPKRMNIVLAAMDFNVNVSIRKDIDFMNRNDDAFDNEEYKAFVKASSTFRNALKTKDISVSEVVVKKTKIGRKIMSYAFPVINGISKEMQRTILRNNANANKLMDVFSKMVAIDKKMKVPLLIDVNQVWIEENYSKMVYKSAIYVINLNSTDTPISNKVVKHLKENGFNIAIKLEIYDETIITIIKRTKPQFIVVGEQLTNTSSSSALIDLISIRRMANVHGVRLIHENPSLKIETKMKEKIGIENSYTLEK